MCGRYTLTVDLQQLADEFGLIEIRDILPNPRYNIAPTQRVPVVRMTDKAPQIDLLRWGLIPSWAKDAEIGNRLINARSETAHEKPSFRSAFKKRRCLVPTTGFYEWSRTGPKQPKQPHYIHRKDGHVFAYAGLWESWLDENGQPIETFTILTTEANELVRPLHDRMPVTVERGDYPRWLDPTVNDLEAIQSLMRPLPDGEFTTTPVSTRVNSPSYDDASCVQPADPPDEQKTLF